VIQRGRVSFPRRLHTLLCRDEQRITAKERTMKRPEMPKKLTLSRETLRMLADADLKAVAGGHSAHEATKCSICPGCTI
jgi:hypothetical protein